MKKLSVAPFCRKDNLVIQEVDGDVLIYDLKVNKAFCLNETSALVWQACNGKRTVSEINNLLSEKLQEKSNENLVWFAIDQLRKEGLVEAEVSTVFAGLSRREIVKRVGLGTMIALPIVAGLVAPTAILAQSGCIPAAMNPTGCPCSVPSNCTSNCSTPCVTSPTGVCCT